MEDKNYKPTNVNERLTSLGNTTQSVANLVKLQLLEGRYNVLISIERYYIEEFNYPTSSNPNLGLLKASIMTLIHDMEPILLDNGYDDKAIIKLKDKVRIEKSIFSAWHDLNNFMRQLGLTKFDSVKYDKSRPGKEDQVKGV